MQQDILQSLWQATTSPQKSNAAIKTLTSEKTHPVLKRIRRQLIIETVAFMIFLVVYYDFFDGYQKPLFANVLLVTGLLLVIIHNVVGYFLTKTPVVGETIKQSLYVHLVKIKNFALVSVLSRILAAGCLLLFFTQVITFTAAKYWVLAGIVLILIIQITLLSAIWKNRIKQLKGAITSFEDEAS